MFHDGLKFKKSAKSSKLLHTQPTDKPVATKNPLSSTASAASVGKFKSSRRAVVFRATFESPPTSQLRANLNLHPFRHFNPEHIKRLGQLPTRYTGNYNEQIAARFVRFRDDAIVVIKEIKLLCQLKRPLGNVCRFQLTRGASDHLIQS